MILQYRYEPLIHAHCNIAIQAVKYGDQSNFVPLIVETGGKINTAGLDFFYTVSGALEGDTAKVRAARRAALYGVADALVRQQGYMLAQIAAEIRSPDVAVGVVGGYWAGCERLRRGSFVRVCPPPR